MTEERLLTKEERATAYIIAMERWEIDDKRECLQFPTIWGYVVYYTALAQRDKMLKLGYRKISPADIEPIANLFMVNCKNCLHGEYLDNDCPHNDEDICMWQIELAQEVLNRLNINPISPDKLTRIPDEELHTVTCINCTRLDVWTEEDCKYCQMNMRVASQAQLEKDRKVLE